MIKYYPSLTFVLSEVKNSPTVLIHSLNGCNLNCYRCINKDMLSITDSYYTVDDIIKNLQLNQELFDYIVVSGGEFLYNKTSDIIQDLKKIKHNTRKKIILYTNGFYYTKMRLLFDRCLIDGIHIDFKLPYHLLNLKDDNALILKTLGAQLNQNDFYTALKSIEYVVKYNNGLNVVRTIRYPTLNESAFKEMFKYIKILINKHKKHIEYHINDFVEMESNNG